MRQLFIDTLAALREADDERDMKLIVLAMNARLPVVFHVRVTVHHHARWSAVSLRTKRNVYLRLVSHQLTMWELMEANGSLAKWV